ncbi:hypothetical protein CTI12_AA345860 [Artemisia annua]|uniref:CCHC-type domain-containing protein n=1 Tax=Artemisia annua TaxID=35608 RepID=A0A2U1MSB7_ARTAN|nr:hypothetical protein CTI12_AA345860 [Artemisia annua]
MRNITVNEAEDEVVGYEGESRNGGIGRAVRTMLGRVHTDRPYSFQRMKKALSAAWRPRRSVTFNELDSNMFLVHFDHYVDFKRVVEDGPWSFERNLVVLKSTENDELPTESDMSKVSFWIRLLNVPLSWRNKVSVGRIAAKLGDVMDVDDAYFENQSKHIRAKVMINILSPLCRFVNVMNLQNEKVRVYIQYEKLPNYCYWCGLLGHIEKECLTKPLEIDGKTFKDWPFNEHLRASNAWEDGQSWGVQSPVYVDLSNSKTNTKVQWQNFKGQM